MSRAPTSAVRIALIGCGAIAERHYAPALGELALAGEAELVAIHDPSVERRAVLRRAFPGARAVSGVDEVASAGVELAIVASPPRHHAEQACALLEAGVHVLCEKPMARTVAEADAMAGSARAAGRVLAVGLFRRFFPALRAIHALVRDGALGAPTGFDVREGGPFDWPAASASFFRRAENPGGVLYDLGIHALDLLGWWFGDPVEVEYQDDAMGNLEANARVRLRYPDEVTGTVRLSRDWHTPNRYEVRFERGRVAWRVGEGNRLELALAGVDGELRGELYEGGAASASYHASFVAQLRNALRAARGLEPPEVPAAEGRRSLALVERCYAARRLLPMPWLEPAEAARAAALAAG